MILKFNIPPASDARKAMEDKGISARKLIRDTGLSSQTVYAYFNGKGSSVDTIRIITEYINNQR